MPKADILDTPPRIVVTLAKDGVIRNIVRGVDLLGGSDAPLIGASVYRVLVRRSSHEPLRQALDAAAAGGSTEHVPLVLESLRGKAHAVVARVYPLDADKIVVACFEPTQRAPSQLPPEHARPKTPPPASQPGTDAAPSTPPPIGPPLRLDEKLFRAAFEQANEALEITDGNLRLVFVNAAWERLTGFGREEVLGRTPASVLRSAQAPVELLESAEESSRRLGQWRGRFHSRRKDGSEVLQELTVAALSLDGADSGFIAIRRNLDEERAKALRRLAAIVQSSQDAIVGLDLRGRIDHWNPAAEGMLGWPQNEVLGKDVLAIFRVADGTPTRFGDSERWGEHYETRLLTRTGEPLDVAVTVSSMRDDDGRILGTSLILRDIAARIRIDRQVQETRLAEERAQILEDQAKERAAVIRDLERTNEELRTAQAKLEQQTKLAAMGELAGGIAHDFNNVLTIMLNNALEVKSQLEQDNSLFPLVDELVLAASRAKSLTTQLATFSRARPTQAEVLDINEIVVETEKLLRRTLGERIVVSCRLEPNIPAVRFDRGHLEQILLNLAINSRDAMPRGGELVITTRKRVLSEDPQRANGPRAKGEHVELEVSDTGEGIPAEYLPRVFEPFFTTKDVGKGTGLGLATVYGMVSQYGGEVFVQSEIGKGTRVRLYLPALSEVPKRRRSSTKLPARVEGVRVLLVEDDAGVRRVQRRILLRGGYTVVEASDGKHALELATASSQPFDAVVTDVMMPVMTGPELVERLRVDHPDLKVLFVSGYPDKGLGDLSRGADTKTAYLQKPSTPSSLLNQLGALLDAADDG